MIDGSVAEPYTGESILRSCAIATSQFLSTLKKLFKFSISVKREAKLEASQRHKLSLGALECAAPQFGAQTSGESLRLESHEYTQNGKITMTRTASPIWNRERLRSENLSLE
jgi:hypothetical protein